MRRESGESRVRTQRTFSSPDAGRCHPAGHVGFDRRRAGCRSGDGLNRLKSRRCRSPRPRSRYRNLDARGCRTVPSSLVYAFGWGQLGWTVLSSGGLRWRQRVGTAGRFVRRCRGAERSFVRNRHRGISMSFRSRVTDLGRRIVKPDIVSMAEKVRGTRRVRGSGTKMASNAKVSENCAGRHSCDRARFERFISLQSIIETPFLSVGRRGLTSRGAARQSRRRARRCVP